MGGSSSSSSLTLADYRSDSERVVRSLTRTSTHEALLAETPNELATHRTPGGLAVMLLAPIVLHIVRDSRNHVLEATTTTTTRPKKRGGREGRGTERHTHTHTQAREAGECASEEGSEGLRAAETHSERRGNTSVKSLGLTEEPYGPPFSFVLLLLLCCSEAIDCMEPLLRFLGCGWRNEVVWVVRVQGERVCGYYQSRGSCGGVPRRVWLGSGFQDCGESCSLALSLSDPR